MYRIYVGDKSIILTNILDKEDTFKYFLLKEASIDYIMNELKKTNVNSVHLYHPKKDKLLKKFKKKLPLVLAAGGLVTNTKGEMLFIKRRGVWDLPKGKLDKNESLEDAAIREVEEETGVKDLKISSFRAITYHIFRRNGEYRLKETYWYDMTTTYDGKLVPQAEEDIEKVAWKKRKDIPKLMKKSYGNLKELLAKEMMDIREENE